MKEQAAPGAAAVRMRTHGVLVGGHARTLSTCAAGNKKITYIVRFTPKRAPPAVKFSAFLGWPLFKAAK